MKFEWKKSEKHLYLPKNKPEIIDIPTMSFYTIDGEGNPNDEFFGDYIQVLYALSYTIKMSYKSNYVHKDFYDYTVYPLEGVWDLNLKGREKYDGTFDKNDLVFKLMIRQANFVDSNYAMEIIEIVKKKKNLALLDKVKFETIEEGKCIQMLHLGSYDSERESFDLMEKFAEANNLRRKSKTHREIYLSDPRKVSVDKLKTLIRFQAE